MKGDIHSFHLRYGRLISIHRLQSDRLKCKGLLANPGTPQNHAWNIAICWKKFKILKLADNLEYALSNKVCKLAHLWETVKWQPERLKQPLFSHCFPSSLKNMPHNLVSHTVTALNRSCYHISFERGDLGLSKDTNKFDFFYKYI